MIILVLSPGNSFFTEIQARFSPFGLLYMTFIHLENDTKCFTHITVLCFIIAIHGMEADISYNPRSLLYNLFLVSFGFTASHLLKSFSPTLTKLKQKCHANTATVLVLSAPLNQEFSHF